MRSDKERLKDILSAIKQIESKFTIIQKTNSKALR